MISSYDYTFQIRLFLSVDISGSTDLKNNKNYMHLLNRFNDLKKIHNRVKNTLISSCGDDDDDATADIIYEILENEDLDWLKTINDTFIDFHTMFIRELQQDSKDTPVFPWKVLGDELIYSLYINNDEELHNNLLAFYKTLRRYDKELCKKNSIRLKGSAWIASFPIRNKIINIPSPLLYYKNNEGNEIKYPYPKEDYLGPEMDIGFRIGKCVISGFIVISIELAYLLGSMNSNDQFRIVNVGWEQLKGVWGGRHYPIYWLELPSSYQKDTEYFYDEIYYPWETATNKFLSKWDKQKQSNELLEAKQEQTKIKKIITKLPIKLGLSIPYFPEDPKKPFYHDEILSLYQKIAEQRIKAEQQQSKDVNNNSKHNIDTGKYTSRLDIIAQQENMDSATLEIL